MRGHLLLLRLLTRHHQLVLLRWLLPSLDCRSPYLHGLPILRRVLAHGSVLRWLRPLERAHLVGLPVLGAHCKRLILLESIRDRELRLWGGPLKCKVLIWRRLSFVHQERRIRDSVEVCGSFGLVHLTVRVTHRWHMMRGNWLALVENITDRSFIVYRTFFNVGHLELHFLPGSLLSFFDIFLLLFMELSPVFLLLLLFLLLGFANFLDDAVCNGAEAHEEYDNS